MVHDEIYDYLSSAAVENMEDMTYELVNSLLLSLNGRVSTDSRNYWFQSLFISNRSDSEIITVFVSLLVSFLKKEWEINSLYVARFPCCNFKH